MNFVDILILIPLAFAAWKGLKKGFVIEIFMLLAVLVGIYCAIHFSDWTSNLIIKNFDVDSKYLPVIAFTLTLLGVGALIFFSGKLIEQMIKAVQLSLANKIFGLIFSITKSLYILSVLIVLLESYDERGQFIPQETKTESILYYPVKAISTTTVPAIKESALWLKNNTDSLLNEYPDLNWNNIKEAKKKADSLGITLDSLQRLKSQIDNQ